MCVRIYKIPKRGFFIRNPCLPAGRKNMNMNKQSRFLVLLILFNLAPGLIFLHFTPKEVAAENKTKTDYKVETQAVLYSQTQAVLYSQINPNTGLVTITAYSSTPEQTDSTPFITASGALVRDGIVACNFLAFNTKIKIPELYGEKIFIVKDRMAKKHSNKIDIWFPTTEQAKEFGVRKTIIEIVES